VGDWPPTPAAETDPVASADLAAHAAGDASDTDLAAAEARVRLALTATPDALVFGDVTPNADGAVTAADVLWPDGTPGLFIGTPAVHAAALGALDAYSITYGSPAIFTYTQPAVTRDAAGNVIARPAIVVT
jgi:hypothetical protein